MDWRQPDSLRTQWSYTPRSKKRLQWQSWMTYIALGVALAGGVLIINSVKGSTYQSTLQKLPDVGDSMESTFSVSVSKKTDARALAKSADGLLKMKLYSFAAIAFHRASDIDPNYRDAAYGWAYARFQSEQEVLSPQSVDEIKQALARVEAVDPLYIPAIKLRLLIAQKENDVSLVEKLTNRLSTLGSQPN